MDENESLETLFAGLAAEPVQPRSPFKFLDAYGAEDRALFFGRDNEIRDLYARFYHGQVLLVYGESGTGKTSLIECGLRGEIPAEEALFVAARTAQDPFEAVQRALLRVLGPEERAGDLSQLARAVIEQKSKALVLVLDQFEEFFLFQPVSVRQAFAQAVRDGLDQNGNLRLVIGLREEYLARATELEPYWPGLFGNRLWIRHLARTDAEAAIIGPCAVCGVAIEEGLVPLILADLSGGGGEVELPIFQVVLDSLYRKALAETPEHPRLMLGAYRELGQVQTILGRFLEERIQSYAENTEAARQILKALVTAEGTRQFGKLQDLAVRARQFGPDLAEEHIAELLRRLIGDRLVREDPDQHWYELLHDALARQIGQWMSGLEQELADLRQTLENRLREYQRHGRLLEADVLATLAPYESRLALRGELAELVELSQRRARQRKRLRFWAGTTVFTVVLAFGILSFAQWQEAQRQKTQAEANFKKTREAVDDFLTQISESTLLNQPGLEPLRRQLLEKALNYYEGLAQQRAEDPEMRAELANAAFRTGNIRQLLGDHPGARAAYQQALDLQERLVREHPEVPEYRSGLARSYNNLGLLLGETGDAAGARAAYQQALDLRERLVREHPEVAVYRNDLGTSYGNLGNLRSDGGDLAGARAAYQQGLDLWERLVREHPEVPAYQSALAASHNNLGNQLAAGGDAVGARAAYQQGLDLWERLVREHPEVPAYQSALAASHNNLGNQLAAGGDAVGARAAYQQALDLQERLVREHPEVLEYQSTLARSYYNLGNLRSDGGDLAGARAAYQQGLDLWERLAREHPEVPAYQSALAASHNNLGNQLAAGGDAVGARAAYQQGLDLWERLAREHPEVPAYQSALAASHNNLGNQLAAGGDAVGARAAYQQALDLQERLVRDHPEVPDYQSDLAGSYVNLFNLLISADSDVAEVRATLLRASEIFARLAREFLDRTDYRASWAGTEGNLAWVELFARHPQEAIAAATRALEADPDQVWIRVNLAHGYLFDNQYAKALAIYTENKDVKLPDGRTFAEAVLADFQEFRAKGIDHPDMAKIEPLLRGAGAGGQ